MALLALRDALLGRWLLQKVKRGLKGSSLGPRFGRWVLVKVLDKLLEAGLVRSVTTPHQLIPLIMLEVFLT